MLKHKVYDVSLIAAAVVTSTCQDLQVAARALHSSSLISNHYNVVGAWKKNVTLVDDSFQRRTTCHRKEATRCAWMGFVYKWRKKDWKWIIVVLMWCCPTLTWFSIEFIQIKYNFNPIFVYLSAFSCCFFCLFCTWLGKVRHMVDLKCLLGR